MSPIPESGGRSRQHGCFWCGAAPTTHAVGVTARPLQKRATNAANGYASGAVIRQRSFCAECADEVWDAMWAELHKKERV